MTEKHIKKKVHANMTFVKCDCKSCEVLRASGQEKMFLKAKKVAFRKPSKLELRNHLRK